MSDKPTREDAEKFLTFYCKGSQPVQLALAYLAQLDELAALQSQLDAARKDTARLDWYIQIQWVLEMNHRGWYLRELDDTVAHEIIIGGFHKTPRQAIDAGLTITDEMDRKDREAIDAAMEPPK